MLLRCICLRPVTRGDLDNTSDPSPHATHRNSGLQHGSFQLPARSVSPADVRRTSSGRPFKQREQIQSGYSVPPKVLGVAELNDVPKSSSQKGVSTCSTRPAAERILQPVAPSHQPEASKRSKLVQRLKWPQHAQSSHTDSTKQLSADVSQTISQHAAAEPPAPCKSILEASARRLARHTTAAKPSEVQQMQDFLHQYMSAVTESNQQWANAIEIADMFASHAVLKTQDKQTFHGRATVLKRLNTGKCKSTEVSGSCASLIAGPRAKTGELEHGLISNVYIR